MTLDEFKAELRKVGDAATAAEKECNEFGRSLYPNDHNMARASAYGMMIGKFNNLLYIILQMRDRHEREVEDLKRQIEEARHVSA